MKRDRLLREKTNLPGTQQGRTHSLGPAKNEKMLESFFYIAMSGATGPIKPPNLFSFAPFLAKPENPHNH